MTDNRNDPLNGPLHDQRPDPLRSPDYSADSTSQAATTWLPMTDGAPDPYDVPSPRLGEAPGDTTALGAAGATHAFDSAAAPRTAGPNHAGPTHAGPTHAGPTHAGTAPASDALRYSQLSNTTHDEDNAPPRGHRPAVARPAERPVVTGPNMAAVVSGLLVALAGGLAALQVLTGDTIDWSRLGPGLFTGIGITLVLIGTIGVVRRRPCRNGSPGKGC